ncbi:hypothetical protein UCRPA7_4524 [Phaeoacremonium minimum UCRPA7]|uniref:Uncharacterized protein n=1 Tax=Phaeoacremonium minimum (strain UCR-PA7) TaxID=1286976 RepID=R8BL54_PHAM7|nr:hypothetical protein UCRPA7_4524 [Phaeoacremonium minimum UCRPA7]EON99942.1 hypothetical protein UCRPA7_4524 [Phaeoacremonium minimum UCRPA7]
MLVRDLKRLVFVIGPLLVFFLVALRCFNWKDPATLRSQLGHWNEWIEHKFTPEADGQLPLPDISGLTGDSSVFVPPVPGSGPDPDPDDGKTHHEIFSVSTADKKYFNITFGDKPSLNPNIIPHPVTDGTWIIVAQLNNIDDPNPSPWFAELVCDAVFGPEGLQCAGQPSILPIAATTGDKCEGDLGYFGFNVGPHDARVFYGPRTPYAMYGSNSMFTCFGQWMQDFRVLVDWGVELFTQDDFRVGTELQRPLPYRPVEKNWFIFWDSRKRMYAHYDVFPTRAFAELNADGSVGEDLAPAAAARDNKCLAAYMPTLPEKLESIHQATNSLAITLCRRADPSCRAADDNTFVFTIIQHKTFYRFHSAYDPYVVVFRQRAPFEIYAISKKPVWIHGRGMYDVEHDLSEMYYVTSMSWKARGQKYHGYLDDVLFLAFGIEDRRTGGIDVTAAALLANLGRCPE